MLKVVQIWQRRYLSEMSLILLIIQSNMQTLSPTKQEKLLQSPYFSHMLYENVERIYDSYKSLDKKVDKVTLLLSHKIIKSFQTYCVEK